MILSSFWRRVLGMSDKPKIVDALGAATAAQGLLAASALQRSDIVYGSNANGQYWRVPDSNGSGGLQVCIGTGVPAGATSTASGVIFQSNVDAAVTFPATFDGTPMVQGVSENGNRWASGAFNVTSSGCNLRALAGTSSATAVNISFIAIGRYT
ncbi:MAG TPA: hypothetical protein PKZ19_16235 [Zoogloea sp.]|nr:hypothetical protein [Zoogloea sp.]